MSQLAVLYLGVDEGTSRDRAHAYRRLGHSVLQVDPRRLLPASPWVDRVIWNIGAGMLAPLLCRALRQRLAGLRFDVCHVDNGECVTPSVIATLREFCGAVINYNIDDPFGRRDRQRFAAYRAAVPHYDAVAVCRQPNVAEARALGARRVLLVYRSADEVTHAPRTLTPDDRQRWGSEVLFLGTWMPERGPLLAELLRLGVPLAIRGNLWQRAPEWPVLKAAYRGPGIHGDDYAMAIQGARISLGLLSKGNRDLHTTRSLEIPALGGLLCAERTIEHTAMYREGVEAVFWSDAQECANLCRQLLADEPRRAAIALAGQRRVHANQHFHEPMLRALLAELAQPLNVAVATA